MNGANGKYVSMFKIDGTPILPPLMSEKRRREMLHYRDMALSLEAKMKITVYGKVLRSSADKESLQLLHKTEPPVKELSFRLSKKDRKFTLQNLQKSETLIYDIKENTVIITQEEDSPTNDNLPRSYVKNSTSYSDEKFDGSEICAQIILPVKPKPEKNILELPPMKNLSLLNPPLISIVPSTPDIANFDLNNVFSNRTAKENSLEKAGAEITNHTHFLENSKPATLIRSNSFTLENPSPVLLKHIEENKLNLSSQNNTFLVRREFFDKALKSQSIHNTQKSIKTNDFSRLIGSSSQKCKPSTASSAVFSSTVKDFPYLKQKKSPYDVKLIAKPKQFRKQKIPAKKTIITTLKKRPETLNLSSSIKLNGVLENEQKNDSLQGMIKKIEANHNEMLKKLIEDQTNEQIRMQESFQQQQKLLLQQLTKDLYALKLRSVSESVHVTGEKPMKMNTSTPTTRSISPIPNSIISSATSTPSSSFYHSFRNSSEKQHKSPETLKVLQEFLNSVKSSYSSESMISTESNGSVLKSPGNCSRQLIFVDLSPEKEVNAADNQRRAKAATVINAHIRGYLVRRLFRTEHVKRIVQTIRDTLILLLDLYMDTINEEKETMQNTVLKARLLQQLSSACQSLHEIFFIVDNKSKMAIIAKDRTYQKTRSKSKRYPA